MRFQMILIALAFALSANAQAPQNWFNLDPASGFPGISTEKAYQELLTTKKSETVIVAIIDSGVDYDHEDLKSVMWVNTDEIPGNGIDDDKNGYIDDINGWNFIGNPSGENVHYDNLEGTRVYAKLRKKFDGKSRDDVKRKDRDDFDLYKELEEGITSKRNEGADAFQLYAALMQALEELEAEIGTDQITSEALADFTPQEGPMSMLVMVLQQEAFEKGVDYATFKGEIKDGYDYLNGQSNFYYNPDLNTREIVGDDYSNSYEKGYGNNDVEGPDAMHGTHVAGIVAAVRDNNLGAQGVADNVKIMAIRAVPAGDERDKDVANAIIYAVDNGAKVVNMSFGKSYPWDKRAVDKAVKYAMKKDVLLVHGAGNDGSEISYDSNYPNDRFEKKGLFGPRQAKNWIEVGAIDWTNGDELCADFSNYSPSQVDVFAPGVDIFSTVPDDGYKNLQGTSMASPVVAGLAALIRSYYPSLSAKEVREVIMESSIPVTEQTLNPNSGELVDFKTLCVTGGVVNAYTALQLAAQKVK